MLDVKTDVEKAEIIINQPFDDNGLYSKYSTSFIFGTENQEGINSVVDYNAKDVLTVASSGDQYLGAVYYGANKVDLYDINRFTRYITFLKISAIRKLSYKEFVDFYFPLDSDRNVKQTFWDLKTLKRLLPVLPEDVGYFWDNIMYLFKKYGYGNFVLPTSYTNREEVIVTGMPFYASEEEYDKLQKILKSREFPKFTEANAFELSRVIGDTYDIVYLSNIIESMVAIEIQKYPFAGYGTEDMIEGEMLDRIIPHVHKTMKNDGTAVIGYRALFDLDMSTDYLYNCICFRPYEIPRKFQDNLRDMKNAVKTDLVLTYQPTKERMFM